MVFNNLNCLIRITNSESSFIFPNFKVDLKANCVNNLKKSNGLTFLNSYTLK